VGRGDWGWPGDKHHWPPCVASEYHGPPREGTEHPEQGRALIACAAPVRCIWLFASPFFERSSLLLGMHVIMMGVDASSISLQYGAAV
jgi:hypothetical protein